jgi:predicted nucleic acid-binding protein
LADLLVDTDVFIDHLRGAKRFRQGQDRILYSVVTRCELFGGRHAREDVVRALLEPFVEVAVNRDIAEAAGRIRRQTHVATADALIAATALHREAAILTRNRRHFAQVTGLRVRAPR